PKSTLLVTVLIQEIMVKTQRGVIVRACQEQRAVMDRARKKRRASCSVNESFDVLLKKISGPKKLAEESADDTDAERQVLLPVLGDVDDLAQKCIFPRLATSASSKIAPGEQAVGPPSFRCCHPQA
ncbi:hypothetical protein GOP47_0009022, partial [Adiantum capillus-veneris]